MHTRMVTHDSASGKVRLNELVPIIFLVGTKDTQAVCQRVCRQRVGGDLPLALPVPRGPARLYFHHHVNKQSRVGRVNTVWLMQESQGCGLPSGPGHFQRDGRFTIQ